MSCSPDDLLRFTPVFELVVLESVDHGNLMDPICPDLMTIVTRKPFMRSSSITSDDIQPRTAVDSSSPEHPQAGLNSYDLAAEWSSDGIELYRPKNEAADEHHSRPALLGPLGKGHGSVKYTIKAKDDTFTVVTIHCIAELMKELASSIDRSGTLPKRVDAMILTQFIWQSLITTLKDLDAILTDDTRIRVTVRARTLKDALEKVRNLPLLNLEEYLHPIHPDFQAFQVRKHVVPASAFVEQATRLQRHV
ncbi:unnamed protein product [Tilletia laevis]|nr:unnamed protein product [Tilletia caries]CAD6950466.1 unnamed protein product [Tilletia laevis]